MLIIELSAIGTDFNLRFWVKWSALIQYTSQNFVVCSLHILFYSISPKGYGFLELDYRATAESFLQNFHGTPMPSSQEPFRLNWDTFGAGDKRIEPGTGYSLFFGDLVHEVTDIILQEAFQSRYSSFKGAKVVIDANAARTKLGYGFVKFGDENEKN